MKRNLYILFLLAVTAMSLLWASQEREQRKEMEIELAEVQLLNLLADPGGENIEGRMFTYFEALLRSERGRTLITTLDEEHDDIAFHADSHAVFYLVPSGPDSQLGIGAVILGEDFGDPHVMSSSFPEFVQLDGLSINEEELQVDYHWSIHAVQASLLKDLEITPGEAVSVRLPVPEKGSPAIRASDLNIPRP